MSAKLYVGNLPFSASEQSLQAQFETCGQVQSCKIIIDRDTGRSKGFAFVEMSSPGDAQNAIQKLNGTSFEGRALNVSEARPQEPRSGGGGGRPRGHRGW